MSEKKLLSEEELKEIASGSGIDRFFEVYNGIGEALALVNQAYETNTCPICNQKINPVGETCSATEALAHIAQIHANNEDRVI